MTQNIKIVMLGDGAVGKTSIVHRWARESFDNRYIATIGVDIVSNTIKLDEDELRLDVWDLAGQEHFKIIRGKFYKHTSGGVLVFDVTNKRSFDNLPKWIEEAERVSGKIPFVIMGNKIDLEHLRIISQEDMQGQASKLGIEHTLETSAFTGDQVAEAFNKLAQIIVESRA